MSVTEFCANPSERSHSAYKSSMWALAAPEYSEGEDLLASAYRGLLLGVQDNAVDKRSIRDLPAAVGDEFGGRILWEAMVSNTGGLTSPSRKETRSASSERLPELMPLVPKVGYYAGVRGKFGRGRWYPANLLLQVFGAGLGFPAGTAAIQKFSDTLTVGLDDDVVARFLERAIPAISPPTAAKRLSLSADDCVAFRGPLDVITPRIPAEAFCCDVASLNGLKRKLTRRQWTVLCEALIRLGLAAHVLWVCHVNSESWHMLLDVAAGGGVPSTTEIQQRIWCDKTRGPHLLELGRDSNVLIKGWLERYVYSRIGLNLCLHKLEDAGCSWTGGTIGHDATTGHRADQAMHDFLSYVAANRLSMHSSDPAGWLRNECTTLSDKRLDLVRAEKGFTRNMRFFLQYGLGQIDTQDPDLKEYDQSYLVTKRGRTSAMTRPVEPGPAMLIALVHACCQSRRYEERDLPASIEDLAEHLGAYGLQAPAGELLTGAVGAALERLGLVVDSPDAAGGRLLVAPFGLIS